MSEKVELAIKEATPEDAAAILAFTRQVGAETDNLIFDSQGVACSLEQEALLLESIQASPTQILLVATDVKTEKIVGLFSITNEDHERTKHIGELGVSVLKDYWGFGIGRLLVEEGLEWAKQTQLLHRIELDVRIDNQRAIGLYLNAGFEVEGRLRHVLNISGSYQDVYRMALLLHEVN